MAKNPLFRKSIQTLQIYLFYRDKSRILFSLYLSLEKDHLPIKYFLCIEKSISHRI